MCYDEVEPGHRDGAAAQALLGRPRGLAILPDKQILFTDRETNRIRLLSADLQTVSTAVGHVPDATLGGYGFAESGFRDGCAAQATLSGPAGSAVLPDGRVLLACALTMGLGSCIRLLSADLQEMSTVFQPPPNRCDDGDFCMPDHFAVLPDGNILVTDGANARIRMISADLAGVSTIAGSPERPFGHRDGAAGQALFSFVTGITVLPDGCVLIADHGNQCIRMLSADLQQVTTVAGTAGLSGHRDGPAAQARFSGPSAMAVLTSRDQFQGILVTEWSTGEGVKSRRDEEELPSCYSCVRMLSADLQQVYTVVGSASGLYFPESILPLPCGRVLIADSGYQRLRLLTGFPPAAIPPKPAAKAPKKRTLAGGDASSSMADKRGRSGTECGGGARNEIDE